MELIAISLWLIIAIFILGGVMWLSLFVLGRLYDEPPRVWQSEDVQVRVMTIGSNVDVIQRTVDSAVQHFDDVRVISEQEIELRGATVHVVPGDFDSEATRKGRAHDWAAKNVSHNREYNLYLDEDTTVTGFDGLPDTDIVQLMELPTYSGSFISWLTEVSRVGYQREIRSFPNVGYPLYLWGGAFAVRASVEKDVGWEEDSLTEDTSFIWRAVNAGATYSITEQWCMNQAPPSIKALITQRRRWFAGTRQATKHLPRKWKAIVAIRAVMWITSMLTAYAAIVGVTVVSLPLWLTISLFILLLLWSVLGAKYYDRGIIALIGTLALFPLIHTINAAGVVYGIVRPPEDFEVTEKK